MLDCAIHFYVFRYAEFKDLHSIIIVNPSNEKRGTIMEWKNYNKTHTSVGYMTIYLQYIVCWEKIFYISKCHGCFSWSIMMGIKATIFREKLDPRIWYLACLKCGKKAQRNNTNSSCQVCNLSTTKTYPR